MTMQFPRDSLPPFLLDTLDTGVISESEAIDLWAVFSSANHAPEMPTEALMAAVERIKLWQMPAALTRH